MNAFDERCARKLLPLIRLKLGRSLRSEVESRDILQVVPCKSFERLDRVKDPAAVMGWLARLAENEIRDHADFHARDRRDAARRAPLYVAAGLQPGGRLAQARRLRTKKPSITINQ